MLMFCMCCMFAAHLADIIVISYYQQHVASHFWIVLLTAGPKRMGFYVRIVFETILQLVICSSDGHMNESTSGRVIS